MAKQIQLTQGFVATVDDADFERINAHKWCAARSGNGKIYALRRLPSRKAVLMHREVIGATSPHVDHEDGDGLNNQQYNLREATAGQNQRNRARQRNNTSGVKGVTWVARRVCWQAQVQHEGKNYFCGYHDTIEAAQAARTAKAAELHGAFVNHG